MGDRIVPTITYFETNHGTNPPANWIDYDDALVDGTPGATQSVALTGLSFTYNGIEYNLSHTTGAVALFNSGIPVGFEFAVVNPPTGGQELAVSTASNTLTVADPGFGTVTYSLAIRDYATLVLDTSNSVTGATFLVTAADGTLLQGEWAMNSSAVVSNGYVDVTDFKLTIESTTYTLAHTAGVPQAHFVGGAFVGLTYDIPNIVGGAFSRITGADGLTTLFQVGGGQQAKPDIMLEKYVSMDVSKLATGTPYRITVKVFKTPNPAGLVATVIIDVGQNDTIQNIKDNLVKAFRAKGVFVEVAGNTLKVAGGNPIGATPADRRLGKMEVNLEAPYEFEGVGEIYLPDDNLSTWDQGGFTRHGQPKPTVIYNGVSKSW